MLSCAAGACSSSKKVKALVEKIHKHVYSHGMYTDKSTLLERNNQRYEEVDA